MREAEAAFGVGDVYLEKYVESPRHIEIQVLGDHHGNVVHLGERECSIQRRHQKLIEEAPSVALTEKQRRRLGATVVDAARAVQYTNAGTFEFLMDPSGHFYFLEANTRLQVEHPVTEFITGVDIVKEQIRIAAGRRLGVQAERHRVPGPRDRVPDQRRGSRDVRAEPRRDSRVQRAGRPGRARGHYAHSECTVSPYYDSLIAKIITYGRDRTEAIARMRRTLEMTVVDGIKTSIPLHLKILADPDFIAGRLSTSFMERYMAERKTADGAGRNRLIGARQCRAILIPHVVAFRLRAGPFPASTPSSMSTPPRPRGLSPGRCCSTPGSSAGVRLVQLRAKALARSAPFLELARAWSSAAAAPARVFDRQRPRRRRARWPAPTACTSARTTCRPDAARASSARTPSSAVSTHNRRADAGGAARARGLPGHRSGVRDDARKARPDPLVGLDGVRARGAVAARRWHAAPLVAIGGITLETAPRGDRGGRRPRSP